MDAAIRKAVELGVAGIVPVLAARSQGAPAGARAEKRLLHWRSIAIAACEQCGRNRVPPVAEPLPSTRGCAPPEAASGPGGHRGDPGAGVSLSVFAARTLPRVVAVGPEGGFTDQETAQAVARGLVPVHMGPRVLRADTAAIAVLAMLAAVGGDAR